MYKPYFKILFDRISSHLVNDVPRIYPHFLLKLKNVGEYQAKNVLVIIFVNGKKYDSKLFSSIAPDELVELSRISEDDFKNSAIRVDVHYEDVLGKLDTMVFIKETGTPTFIVMRKSRMPGLLINSYETLLTIWRVFIFHYKLRSFMRKTEKSLDA